MEIKTKVDDLTEKGILTKPERDALIRLIADLKVSWPDAKFKLFGSKVAGKADEESDLDILILIPSVTEEIRRKIIHKVFDINLEFNTTISALIIAEKEWSSSTLSLLPIHAFIEEEGVAL